MPYYLTQVGYTPESWAAQMKSQQDVRERVGPAAEALGGRVEPTVTANGPVVPTSRRVDDGPSSGRVDDGAPPEGLIESTGSDRNDHALRGSPARRLVSDPGDLASANTAVL